MIFNRPNILFAIEDEEKACPVEKEAKIIELCEVKAKKNEILDSLINMCSASADANIDCSKINKKPNINENKEDKFKIEAAQLLTEFEVKVNKILEVINNSNNDKITNSSNGALKTLNHTT